VGVIFCNPRDGEFAVVAEVAALVVADAAGVFVAVGVFFEGRDEPPGTRAMLPRYLLDLYPD